MSFSNIEILLEMLENTFYLPKLNVDLRTFHPELQLHQFWTSIELTRIKFDFT